MSHCVINSLFVLQQCHGCQLLHKQGCHPWACLHLLPDYRERIWSKVWNEYIYNISMELLVNITVYIVIQNNNH